MDYIFGNAVYLPVLSQWPHILSLFCVHMPSQGSLPTRGLVKSGYSERRQAQKQSPLRGITWRRQYIAVD